MAAADPGASPETETDGTTLVNRKIGERLLELRQARGLTLVAVAKRLGISYQQVQKYERGSSTLPAPRLYELAHVYEVAPAEFFRDLPTRTGLEDPRSATVQDFAQSPEGRKLLAAIAPMPPAARRALLDLLRSMLHRRG
ncbi:MAG: helix-turn-helix transcriptional regulator [Paracoccaceae bacterium]